MPIDLRRAEFHPAGDRQVSQDELVAWRDDLNAWAHDRGYPSALNSERRSTWDVELGARLIEDTSGLSEALHPDVWCWIATHLLPHFVVYRWGWPNLKDGSPPAGRSEWARFGPDLRNALRLAMHRILTYGPDLAARASEQEFQSIQYRPAFGLDQRVARIVLHTLVEAFDDPNSNYGKNGGTRSLDNNDVCIELRVINSLRPLCFVSDENLVQIVHDVVKRLPDLRSNESNSAAPTELAERETSRRIQGLASSSLREGPRAETAPVEWHVGSEFRSPQMAKNNRASETYRSSPTAKLRDISAVPLGRTQWTSRINGLVGLVTVEHTTARLRFSGVDRESGRQLRSHDGPSPAVLDSVGNPPGKGKNGEFTCNGWLCLYDEFGRRLNEIAPPVEGDVR
ncbi:hypothetical protein [Ilumatobacter sp.]